MKNKFKAQHWILSYGKVLLHFLQFPMQSECSPKQRRKHENVSKNELSCQEQSHWGALRRLNDRASEGNSYECLNRKCQDADVLWRSSFCVSPWFLHLLNVFNFLLIQLKYPCADRAVITFKHHWSLSLGSYPTCSSQLPHGFPSVTLKWL